MQINDTTYQNYSQSIANYTVLEQYNYVTNGRDQFNFIQGDIDFNLPADFRVSKVTYSHQKQKPLFEKNGYGFYEYDIDLSNMVLKGSTASYDPRDTRFSSFIVSKDYNRIVGDASKQCEVDPECESDMEGDAFIRNWHYQQLYSRADELTEEELREDEAGLEQQLGHNAGQYALLYYQTKLQQKAGCLA